MLLPLDPDLSAAITNSEGRSMHRSFLDLKPLILDLNLPLLDLDPLILDLNPLVLELNLPAPDLNPIFLDLNPLILDLNLPFLTRIPSFSA
jgi:hypothetical protein